MKSKNQTNLDKLYQLKLPLRFRNEKWENQLIQRLNKIFGEENVHIGLFEEFISNKKLFLNKICDHLGIDDYNVSDNQGIVVNKKLTNHGAYICRKGNNYLRSTYNNSRGNLLLVKILSLLTSSRQLSELIKDTEKRIVPNYGKYDLKQRKMHALNWRGVIIFRRIAEKIKFGKPISIPDDIKKQLTQHCKESNNSLIKCFNLPVDKYNYSI